MKKLLVIIISVSILIGMCTFAVFASENGLSDKIYDEGGIVARSADDDLIETTVYYNVHILTSAEKDQIIYERYGIRPEDGEIIGLKPEDDEYWEHRAKRQLYLKALNDLNDEIMEQNAQPFLDYMGIELIYKDVYYQSRAVPTYHDHSLSLGLSAMWGIWLTKAEIIKAAESDYVKAINCIDPDYIDPLQPTTDCPVIEVTEVVGGFVNGDVNGDNVLDIHDSTLIQKFAVNKTNFSEAQQGIGDFNKDKVCDILDSLEIQKAIVS